MMERKFVFVVMSGERCEGGAIVGIYETEARAMQEVLAMTDQSGWTRKTPGFLTEKTIAYYEKFVDYIEVQKVEVES
jgi:hypothetical protein